MAPLVTPEQILAGQANQADPNAAPNAVAPAPAIGTSVPTNPGQDILSGAVASLPPAPARGGISEDPRTQLLRQFKKNSDDLMAQASDPNAPGTWAKALVGGMQSALAGGANIGTVPKGAGALYGISKVAEAQQAQQRQKQQDAEKAKQQKFENSMSERKEEREEEATNYERGLRQIQTQGLMRNLTKAANDDLAADSKSYIEAHKAEGASVVQEHMTWSDLQKLAKEHATAADPFTGKQADPQGINWLMDQNIHQDGWKDVTDPQGNIKPQTDVDGNITGGQRQQTYNMMTWGDARTVDQKFSDDLKNWGVNENITPGTKLDPKTARLLEVRLQHAKAEEEASNIALAAAGKTKDEIAKYQKNEDYQAAIPVFSHWLNDAQGNPGLALRNMEQHAQEKNPDGTQTPEAAQAAKDYDTVTKGLGPEIVKYDMDLDAKKEVEQIKANAAAAKNEPLKIEGDPSLHGDAYIQSLPPGRQAIIRSVANGQINGLSPQVLRSAQGQQLIAEAHQVDPDLDGGLIADYPGLVKAFNVGKEAQQIKAINTAVPHLNDLYTALEKGTWTTMPGVSWIERKAGNQNAIDVETLRSIASQELAKIYATSAVTDQEHEVFDKQLQGFKTTKELEGTLYSMISALNRQVSSLDNQWQQGLPSPNWRPKRVVIDPDTRQAMDNVISMHSGKGPIQTPKLPPPAAGTTRLIDGNGFHYDVPAANVAAVLKQHPQLQQQEATK